MPKKKSKKIAKLKDIEGFKADLSPEDLKQYLLLIGWEGYDLSDGINRLLEGFFAYTKEVIVRRSFVNLYDGLKPVQRKIAYVLYKRPDRGFMKCVKLSGDTLLYHPHGDTAVYGAATLMTQHNGSFALPIIEGSGYFGKMYSTDSPAAARYTEARLSKNAELAYFGEMEGIKMIPNFNETLMEPEVLPVSFPAVLVNGTVGADIGVGLRSNLPTFNFNEVCDLVSEYIREGKCTTVIAPDFVTGGEYVKDDKELMMLMRVGKASLEIRGKTEVHGKALQIKEIAYGKTVQGLVAQINNLDDVSIKNAYDASDFEHGMGVTVTCQSVAATKDAYRSLYKSTGMQYSFPASITVIKNDAPVSLGAWGVIAEWVAWRKEVLQEAYTKRESTLRENLAEATAFMNLVNDKPKCLKAVNIAQKEGRDVCRAYIKKSFTRKLIPEDQLDFVSTRSLDCYHDGGRYAKVLADSSALLEELENLSKDLGQTIINQMEHLKKTQGKNMPRKTKVVTGSYRFKASAVEKGNEVGDMKACYYTYIDGFLKKTTSKPKAEFLRKTLFDFEGVGSSTILALDNRGRLLRVYGEDVEYSAEKVPGLYLERYFDLKEEFDYKIMWMGIMPEKEMLLLYTDGNLGFIDPKEWEGVTRRVRVIKRGIASSVADQLGAVIYDVPERLFVRDAKGKIAWVDMSTVIRKNRTAKTRGFSLSGKNPITSYALVNGEAKILRDPDEFIYKLKKPVGKGSFTGSYKMFVDTLS